MKQKLRYAALVLAPLALVYSGSAIYFHRR